MTARTREALKIANLLLALDDEQIRKLVSSAEQLGIGIGGMTKTVRIGDETIFVKQLPLTKDEEADPTSTVSQLQLPFTSHYGIGCPSAGAGRELAAHQLTSQWVQSEAAGFFPLLLGWRIVDLKSKIDLSEFDGEQPRDQWGAHWPQLDQRLRSLEQASKSMVLFLEYVPDTLGAWLRRSFAEGSGARTFPQAVDQILEATAWMSTQGFLHFDVHPGNILVKDERLLLTDFGLSLHHDGFELTSEEKSALDFHRNFDRDSALMHLFQWVLYELGYTTKSERLALLRAAAADRATSALDPVREALGDGADIIAKFADIAADMTEMYSMLLKDATATEYQGINRQTPGPS